MHSRNWEEGSLSEKCPIIEIIALYRVHKQLEITLNYLNPNIDYKFKY